MAVREAVSVPAIASDGRTRLLVTIVTTDYRHLPDADQLPELIDDQDRMRQLLTRPEFGYRALALTDPRTGADAGINPTMDQLRTGLQAIVSDPARAPDDLLVVYYAGHGVLDQRRDYVLVLSESDPERPDSTGLPATELARWLTADAAISNVLLILDTCYADAASATFIASALPRAGAGAIIAGARPSQSAEPGCVTKALVRAVEDPAVAGYRPSYLPIDELVRAMNADPQTPVWQTITTNLFGLRHGQPPFLPNPRRIAVASPLDQLVRNRTAHDALRRDEQITFFNPRARGVPTADDHAWRFVGRQEILAHLSHWLSHIATDRRHRLILGDPGSGKSSVIARLCLLADAARRNQIPELNRLSPATRPTDLARLASPIHARGKDAGDILSAVATACSVVADTTGHLIDLLSRRPLSPPLVVPIDAIDEATEAKSVAATIIQPLLDQAAEYGLVLLLGTRDHLVPALGLTIRRTGSGARQVIDPRDRTEAADLDGPLYADPHAVGLYIGQCLRTVTPTSPYRDSPSGVVDRVSTAIAAAAGKSFLVGYLAASAAAHQPVAADPYDPGWLASLPRTAGEAMRQDIDARLGDHARLVRDLLTPLAYAQGQGMPWSDLWAPLAANISQQAYTNTDIELLRELAGAYVIEAEDPTAGSLYRLFHEALAEHLREQTHSAQLTIHRAFAEHLLARIPTNPDGRHDWHRADQYTLTHLSTHAAEGHVLDPLVNDVYYLLAANQTRLLAALTTISDPDAKRSALAYRHAAPNLRNNPADQRHAYLHLRAHQVNAIHLTRTPPPSTAPWQAVWASWRPHHPHQTLTGHTGGVWSVAQGQVAGRDVIVSGGGDATVRMWDAATATPMGAPLAGHTGEVTAVAIRRIDDRDIIASGGTDGTIRMWDAATGSPIGQPLTGHSGGVWSVALARFDDRDIVISGGSDATVRMWDASTHTAIGGALTGHTSDVVSVAVAHVKDRNIIVSGSNDRTVRAWVWDAATATAIGEVLVRRTNLVVSVAVGKVKDHDVIVSGGNDRTVQLWVWDDTIAELIRRPLARHTSGLWSVAVGRFDGRDVVLSGGTDGTVRVWDATTGTPVGASLTGHTGGVQSVAAGKVDGRDVIVSGGTDGTVRVWDATTGSPMGPPPSGHTGEVVTVAVGRVGGRDIIVSGGADATVRMWDTATGIPTASPLTGHTDWVRSVALGQVGGRDIVVSGGDDETVRLWDAAAATAIGQPLIGHTGAVRSVAVARADGRDIIVSGSGDRTMRLWDAATATAIGHPIVGHTNVVRSVAVGRVEGHDIIVSGSNDRTIRMWDAITAAPIGKPLTGHAGRVLSVMVGTVDGHDTIMSCFQSGGARLWTVHRGISRLRWRIRPRAAQVGLTRARIWRSDALIGAVGNELRLLGPRFEAVCSVDLAAEVADVAGTGDGLVVVATDCGIAVIRFNH